MNINHLDLGAMTWAQLGNLKAQAIKDADMDAYRRLNAAQIVAAHREADERRRAALFGH